MSSFAGYCIYCNKPVMHKTFFGTLHVCLTDEERAAVQRRRAQAERAQSAQQRVLQNGDSSGVLEYLRSINGKRT